MRVRESRRGNGTVARIGVGEWVFTTVVCSCVADFLGDCAAATSLDITARTGYSPCEFLLSFTLQSS